MRFNMSRLEGRILTDTETAGWLIFNGVMLLVWIVLKTLDTLYPPGVVPPCLPGLAQHQTPVQGQQPRPSSGDSSN